MNKEIIAQMLRGDKVDETKKFAEQFHKLKSHADKASEDKWKSDPKINAMREKKPLQKNTKQKREVVNEEVNPDDVVNKYFNKPKNRNVEDRFDESVNYLKESKKFDTKANQISDVPSEAIERLMSKDYEGARAIVQKADKSSIELLNEEFEEKEYSSNNNEKSSSIEKVSKDEIKNIIYEMLESYKGERLRPLFKEIFLDIFKEYMLDMKNKKKK